jgi:hypothetical protein
VARSPPNAKICSYEIVAERISNTFADKYVTSDMNWGTDQEAAAKEAFENLTGLDRHRCRVHRPPAHQRSVGLAQTDSCRTGALIEVKCASD